jgi:hypothetical protein
MSRAPGRPLTSGEAAMAAALFGRALDPAPVRVHAGSFFWFNLQPRDTALAPRGAIWFPPAHARADFAHAPAAARHWFMHELVHVWQHQLGYPVLLRGALRLGLRYRYVLAPGRRLGDYNMEAQGDLLADYFALRHLGAPQVMRQNAQGASLALYEAVLAGFLADPGARVHLPRWCSRRGC